MIASLCTVVSQLEETTREVVTLSQQRHAKYQKEAEALKAENARLQAQLDEEKKKKAPQYSSSISLKSFLSTMDNLEYQNRGKRDMHDCLKG